MIKEKIIEIEIVKYNRKKKIMGTYQVPKTIK